MTPANFLASLRARALALDARLGRGFQQSQQERVALLAFLVIHGGHHTMSAEDKEDPEAPLLSTVLSQIPATDPAILRDMENTRLANRHYSAIGKIAGWWAYFEFFIDIDR